MVTEKTIYEDIAERTGGDIYVGVVGPVRTGKSTFIKRFMESLVLPEINSEFDRERARDEMPQSAAGRTVMTTEPKFVPDEAVSVMLGGSAEAKVRLIDCVGYIVPEALGHIEDGSPRMVMTIRGEPSSMCPSASGTIYPTQSISLTFASALPPSITETASSGTNLGSVVITVLPAALCGISSRARSRSNSLFISGSTSDSIKRLINVDFPVRTGPTTPT